MVSFNQTDQASALGATLNNSSLAPTKFKIFASTSLTPQNVRPITDIPQGITNTGTASRVNGNGSLLGQQRGQVPSRNDTMNNSHIQGRKIDSPKIYVKDVIDRPKTSAQQARKSSQAPGKKSKGTKERLQDKKGTHHFLLLAPQTQKDADTRKFDFKFAQTTKADSQKREKSRKSVGRKKPNLNKSQVINLHGEKAGHHRTQTIHGGVPNYEVVNLKLSNGQRSSGGELQAVLPTTVLSPTDPTSQSQYVSWTNEQIKVMTNPQRTSQERRQHQSFQIPKSSNVDSSSQLQHDQLINIQFPQGSKVQAGMKRAAGKAIPTKGEKVQRKGQHMHNQTMVISKPGDYATEGQRAAKTQRSGLGASSQVVITAPERKRTKSGERAQLESKRKTSKDVTKSTKSRKEYARNSHSGLHEFEKIAAKCSKANSGIEILNNKENFQGNSSQIIVGKETRVTKRDMTISSASSQSRRGANDPTEKFGKLFKNNFFVDGEQLLKHMSPDTPQKNISIQASNDQFTAVAGPNKGRPSTTKTSGTRPQSKAIGPRHPGEDSGKITLDHESLQCHQKNRLQILDVEEGHSSRKRDSKQKAFLSQQLSHNQEHSPTQKSKTSGLDRLVKNNIRKKVRLNTDELIKKFMEETQRKKKKDELNNRNAEVRKMNAKAAPTEQERLQELLNKMKYKKKRSKSCMNKSDNIFMKMPVGDKDPNKRGKRDKSNENNKTSVLSGLLEPLLSRKNQEVAGRNNAVTELNQLKREIDDEIRRDRREGRLDLLSPSANPAPAPVKPKLSDHGKKPLKPSKDVKEPGKVYTALRIAEPDTLLERKNREVQGNLKLKIQQDEVDRFFASTGHVKSALQGMNTTKIQKFIEKQKRRNAAKNKLEIANQQEKAMKVHQNLVNLHNFTVKDRKKHTKENGFFNLKKPSSQQTQLMEHVRSHPIANLKIGKKRKPSLEDHNSSASDINPRKIKVQPLRLRQNRLDQETDLLEQTIQIDSSRMEVDNSIINIYRKLSGSRKSSNDSKLRSALRSSSGGEGEHRRSLSGGRRVDHPPLKVLHQVKESPTNRAQSNERTQSSGSAFLRRKHQEQLQQVERQRQRKKLSPDLRNVKDANTTEPQIKPCDSIEVSAKQHTSEQFESIEPTRTAKQIKRSTEAKVSSIASQNSVVSFDKKVQELAAKYGRPGESEPQLLVRLHTAAIKIQVSFRKHQRQEPQRVEVKEVKAALPPKRSLEIIELEVRKQTSSDQNIKLSSRDGTGQSLRKGLIPTLDLEKIGSQKRPPPTETYVKLNIVEPKEDNEPPASTSRSIFARHTFRDFLDKIGMTSIEEVSTKTFPEMMRVREQAIQHRHRMDETKIDTLYRQKQISPRTYDRRRFELEKWVDKEREEVRRTKKHVEEEQQKTARILRYSAENSEQIKRILNGQENGYHNISTRSHHQVPQTLTDRIQSARLSSKRGDGKSNIIALIYDQEPDHDRQRHPSLELAKKSNDLAGSDDSSKRLDSKPTSHRKSPLILNDYVDHSPIDGGADQFSNLIVANPNGLKGFPQTAQKPTMKNSFANSNQKSRQTSDNPESLRDLISEHDEQLKTPQDKTITNRSLDIDGAIDPELEEQFNQHINTQLLGKIIQEERESLGISDQQSSAKPSKKSDDNAPAGPFRQRRQAFEVSNDKDKPLHRVTSQQQLQDRDIDLYEEEVEELGKAPAVVKPRNSLQIPEDEDDLARKVMEVSPVSNAHSQLAFSKEDLKDSIRSEKFFINNLNKINAGQGTSFEDLQDFNSQQKDLVAQLQGVDNYEMPNINFHGVTTPLSEGHSDKIRIEFGGQPLTGNDGFAPAVSFYIGNMVGAPVSPMSNESIGGIKCGATSLSSNTSEEKSMPLPGTLHVIHEMPEEQRSRLDQTFVRPDQLHETNQTLHLSALDTTGKLDSELQTNLASQETSSKKSPVVSELPKQLPKELIEGGERLADELFQLLLVELSIDLPSLVNRHVHRNNESGLHFKDQAHGIKTDLFAIERYVEEVKAEIMTNPKEFMDSLSKPLAKEPMHMLNMLQNSEIGSCEHFAENYPQILHLDLYLTLEKRRKERREKQIQEIEAQEGNHQKTQAEIHGIMFRTFLAECEHIHNKVLFDCINDSLLQFKPYGKEGPPLSWTRQARRLKPAEDFTINEIFEVVKHDLFAWAIFLAGTLARREMVYQGVFDQDLFDEIREKKLLHMIYCEMVETEPKWLNYEFELAQVKIDVGDMILEQLVNETIAVLAQNASRDLADSQEENGKSHNIEDSWPSAS